MSRTFLTLACLSGFLAVALGAFGAHGLQSSLAGATDAAKRLEWWETAAHYHLMHSFALALAGGLASRTESKAATVAGCSFALGILVFSGSLYTMTLTGLRALGAVTPIGGIALLVGWAAAGLAARAIGD
jgi:uncharacterized membrane protein YgdD (TMEM256/DUF423 family)